MHGYSIMFVLVRQTMIILRLSTKAQGEKSEVTQVTQRNVGVHDYMSLEGFDLGRHSTDNDAS